MENVKIENMFTLEETIAKDLFEGAVYPWEVLPNIKNFILTLGNRLTCLHIHDNNGKNDLHLMPYTNADTWEGKLVTDWNGMLEGLKEIGYKGNISFESYMSFNHFPAEVHPEALKLLSAIGRHFKNKITEE